ncbi:MAG: arginine--tRNA ligase [Flavobacteriales bacterium]|nr:arginine--tRNA ligase [Flavobacteriales bacterium]
MNLLKTLDSKSKEILRTDYDLDIAELQWQKTRKDFDGEVTLVTFPLTRALKKSPEEIGSLLGEKLSSLCAEVHAFNVVKGFLNIEMTDAFWIDYLNSIRRDSEYGFAPKDSKQLVMVEYSSPNTNKPLHLGHLRNNFLGWSVSEILKANGHPVKRVQIINDRGIHICKSMQAWSRSKLKETPEESGIKGDKLVGKYYVEFDRQYKKEINELIAQGVEPKEAEKKAPSLMEARELLLKWESKEPETYSLWTKMNSWVYDGFDATYRRMGVDFDKNYYESETYLIGKQKVIEGLEKDLFYQKEDGSIWVDLEAQGMDQKILLRSDGTAVYMTQDIGTAILRFEENPELAYQVYTVGNEQDYHFKVLFSILGMLGYDWAKDCYHLSYGMVDLPTGRMKSREGTVVDADDLMDEMVLTARKTTEELGKLEGLSQEKREELFEIIGLGALKYFLLKVDPKKRMMFNPDESIDFTGNTAPFIQYTHARIKSILRRDSGAEVELSAELPLHSKERELITMLKEFPDTVKEAGDSYSPALIANYCYELVKVFNQYYQSVPILSEDSDDGLKNLRLTLVKTVAEVISRGMGLLGITLPEQM